MAFLDENGVLYLWGKIKSYVANAISGKVDSVDGKGLSTNDYTDEDKNKLSGVASGAQVNVIETVKVNGTAQSVTGKAVDVSVPTATSDLTNDSGFITIDQVPEGAVASATTPSMDGTASAGSEAAFARGDHVHPHDSTKVDKVTGKGLSSNDYTTTDKEKLAGIESGAQVNPTNVSAFTNDAGYITQHQDISGKVDKVNGKGLSENDYTTAEKNKLQGIAAGAQVNIIESVKVNGAALTPTNKSVNVIVPEKTSDITNDSGFITSADVPEGAAASTTTPKMDGTAVVGSETAFARGDHVHPSDTTKLDVSTFNTAMTQATTELSNKLYVYQTTIDDDTSSILTATLQNDASPRISFDVLSTDGASALYATKANLSTLGRLVDDKVDKVDGKGLSTNDYTTAEKNKLAAFASASNYALKSDIASMYKYKGSVATTSALPSSGNTTGDVWNVEASGMNYAWNGSEWDALGESFQITAITNAELDSICT